MKPMDLGTVPEKKLSQNVEVGTLCAFYGDLLTERQRTALQLHCNEDWSLAEVADHFGVSRQNVHELIARSIEKLARYEKILGGIAQAQRISAQLHTAASELEKALPDTKTDSEVHIQKAIDQIRQMIADIDGEE